MYDPSRKQQTFGLWVKERRRRLDLTREGLALCAGCSLATIEKIETGERRASRQIAELLAVCLKVPAADVPALVNFARGELEELPLSLSVPARQGHAASQTLLRLPSPPTAFIGREREVGAICDLLRREDVRLLTLLGPPGIGKTRLSIQVAALAVPDFRDGAFFVALASVTTENHAASAIAQALGVRETNNVPLRDALKRKLRDMRLLLVLDNFEQVVSAGQLVADLLLAAPGLKALITSRTLLNVYGEYKFPVPPMSLPDAELGPRNTELVAQTSSNLSPTQFASTGYEAIDLFVQRAVASNSAFTLTEENAQAVVQLCRRLDGLPLAIELAAHRVKVLSPQMILARLQRSLDLLTYGPTDLPTRQRTLRGAIDWSYSTLDPDEQALFRRLSVFSGGCTLSAISGLDFQEAASNDFEIDYYTYPEQYGDAKTEAVEPDFLKILSSLIDKSLLQRENVSGEPRFSMLETVREYAWEKLNLDEDECRKTIKRHTDYYLQLAAGSEVELSGAQQVLWLDLLEREHDNFRVALQRSSEKGDFDTVARFAVALRRFWYLHAHLSEGREWFQHILAHADGLTANLRAGVLHGAGTLAWAQGDNAVAGQFFEASLAIWRELGDKRGIANMLNNLGIVALPQGDYVTAHALHNESLYLYRELGDRWSVALALANLGLVALDRGEYSEARELLADSLRLRRALSDRQGVAQSLNNLGIVMRCLGEWGRARTLHLESLDIFESLGDRWSVALTLGNLGILALETDLREAKQIFTGSLELFVELDARQGIATCLEGFAELDVATGQTDRAALLFGAVEEMRRVLGIPLPRYRYENYTRRREEAQKSLGETRFYELWRDGQSLPLEPLCALVLEKAQK